ncbi:5-amino-6-(D-ribitylamino)uracil--L-tyrosine 4-hydroxyphenyl transferase CofH [Sphingosinicella terrae]|uniref:5-amino-6-(D-ribitylamino)uracil--L-tyrosine 4-hydroxyphenyl transferase CofH n=1 Tax=Sphingosinicella terrae TaxID=2172047 RepID=UPI000E0CCF12|nr:5-amino-6-(D-ribitylamino)uracil--L-tyrosine 4-hydroxyphenyl transferase CofH [Sphingosinicella terrae]
MDVALPRNEEPLVPTIGLIEALPHRALLDRAAQLRDQGHGRIQTWSPKVFIPLTRLCRDLCHYCTFSRPPSRGEAAYLTPAEVLAIARRGREAGCTEALFTLGDKPERRYPQARRELEALGHATTLSYLEEMCGLVLVETGLLPHVNAGVMGGESIGRLRRVSASQGLMLETASERLSARGGPHFRSPDKRPSRRLETIRLAGERAVPLTSGILIGIGETRAERIEALAELWRLHRRYGHIQEIIVQNFRAKARTPMATHPEPDFEELCWTIGAARLIFGPEMNIQAPPNLSDVRFGELIDAGINDWGGISPVTPDHVNPEAPWPTLERLRAVTEAKGRLLVKRLPVYPSHVRDGARWLDAAIAPRVRRGCDAEGFARDDGWSPGKHYGPPSARRACAEPAGEEVARILGRASAGEALGEAEIVRLFAARAEEVEQICDAADRLRRAVNGDAVTYVVNRNVNYTNICTYRCGFCAFSKGSRAAALGGPAYLLDLDEVARRAAEASDRGATELCLQGGIHPRFDGRTYLDICRAVRRAAPRLHIHAFSPLEVMTGARSLGLPTRDFMARLKEEGLASLPGTAAEILDDDVRAILCPDKLSSAEWIEVIETAHALGLPTTATIMFGHVDKPVHWARHLRRVRELQRRTGGITEFVPLPFVHMEAPMALKGQTRLGPTMREVRLMHAVARLVLHPLVPNIQASWVKLGPEGVRACLDGGVNDLGGTLMNESISRAAGSGHGQELAPQEMEALIRSAGREPRQRTTLYGLVDEGRRRASFEAAPLRPAAMPAPRRTAKEPSMVPLGALDG